MSLILPNLISGKWITALILETWFLIPSLQYFFPLVYIQSGTGVPLNDCICFYKVTTASLDVESLGQVMLGMSHMVVGLKRWVPYIGSKPGARNLWTSRKGVRNPQASLSCLGTLPGPFLPQITSLTGPAPCLPWVLVLIWNVAFNNDHVMLDQGCRCVDKFLSAWLKCSLLVKGKSHIHCFTTFAAAPLLISMRIPEGSSQENVGLGLKNDPHPLL